MKPCKFCGEIIPKSCKICPKCMAKQPSNDVLKYIAIVIAFIVFVGIVAGSSDSTETEPENTEIASQQKETENKEETQTPEIVYTKYDVDTLLDELEENALKAEKTHQNEYVEITGVLNVIDSDGKYISLTRNDDEITFIDITCYIKSDEQKEKVIDMKIGDTVTLKGKIVSIGEILGYSLNIDSIN